MLSGMAHIHTSKGEHDLSVTAFIVRVDESQPKVLLHKHRSLNILLPIGGHVELIETPWQGVIREIAEESGYDISQLKLLQPKSRIRSIAGAIMHPYPLSMNTHKITDDHSHSDIEYGFIVESEPKHSIGNGESLDFQWLTVDELKNLPKSVIHDNARDISRFILEEAVDGWDWVDAKGFEV